MYKPSPDLDQPGDESLLWRYVDLAKFLHLLQSKTVYFSPLFRAVYYSPNGQGVYINVDLRFLIKEVVVSPEAKDWFVQSIKNLVESHKLQCDVYKSKLLEKPTY